MAESPSPRVGFIGVGRMGMPMCRNLLTRGVSLTVFNRTADKCDALREAGAIVAPSVAILAASCDVVIACLDTVAASERVFLADDGVVAHAKAGTLLIDHGTISPDLAVRIAARARDAGMDFLDAPVSGGPEGAATGTLAVMVGGSLSAFSRALPVVGAYGSTIRRMGDSGTGTQAKLLNQLLTFVHGAVAAESLALAERLGLDLEVLGEVLRAGFGQSRMLDRTLARVTKGDYTAGAALSLYAKDLGIVETIGTELSMPHPLIDAARAVVDDALQAGFGSMDISALRLRYRDVAEQA